MEELIITASNQDVPVGNMLVDVVFTDDIDDISVARKITDKCCGNFKKSLDVVGVKMLVFNGFISDKNPVDGAYDFDCPFCGSYSFVTTDGEAVGCHCGTMMRRSGGDLEAWKMNADEMALSDAQLQYAKCDRDLFWLSFMGSDKVGSVALEMTGLTTTLTKFMGLANYFAWKKAIHEGNRSEFDSIFTGTHDGYRRELRR